MNPLRDFLDEMIKQDEPIVVHLKGHRQGLPGLVTRIEGDLYRSRMIVLNHDGEKKCVDAAFSATEIAYMFFDPFVTDEDRRLLRGEGIKPDAPRGGLSDADLAALGIEPT